MAIAENAALVQRAVDAFNRGDWTAVEALVATDCVDHDPGRAALPPEPAGVQQAWRMMSRAIRRRYVGTSATPISSS